MYSDLSRRPSFLCCLSTGAIEKLVVYKQVIGWQIAQ